MRKRTHIRKDGTISTRYYARLSYRDGEGNRVWDTSSGFRTKREAEAEYIRMRATRGTGTYTAPSAMTASEFMENHWLPSIKARVKATTYDNYERMWSRHVEPKLGALRLQSVTPLQIDALFGDLAVERTVRIVHEDGSRREEKRRALKPKTVRNVHLMLTKAFGDAEDAELLARNPARRAKPPRVVRMPEDEIKVWDERELRSFLTTITQNRWFPEIRLAAMTGMRRAEVLGLRWADTDLDRSTLTVRQTLVAPSYRVHFDTPKSHKPRTIDLDAVTVRMLKRRRASQSEERLAWGETYAVSDLVFTREDGSWVHPDSFSQAFERLVRQTGLPRITLHGLRHTHATLLLKAGVSIKVVSERLGHSDPGFTLRQYAHVLGSMQADAAATFADLIDAPGRG